MMLALLLLLAAPAPEPVSATAAVPDVVVVYVESARQPRGGQGRCPADGKVVQVKQGKRYAFGSSISVGVPCAMFPDSGSDVVPMWAMHDGTFARISFGADRRMLRYEPLMLVPARR
jgi:hypothetical protein